MPRKLVNMRLPDGLLARADAEAERLGQTRTKFMERALESALAAKPTFVLGASGTSPAPVRAPVVVEDVDAFAAGEVDHSAEFDRVNVAMNPDGSIRNAASDLMMERQRRLNKRGKK